MSAALWKRPIGPVKIVQSNIFPASAHKLNTFEAPHTKAARSSLPQDSPQFADVHSREPAASTFLKFKMVSAGAY
jgi:hypothetical protein